MDASPEMDDSTTEPRPPRSSRPGKGVAIALAIFILFLALWRLMTDPQTFGSAGPWLKTNIFGAGGSDLAGSFGLGGSEQGRGTTNGAGGDGFDAVNADSAALTNHGALGADGTQTNGTASDKRGDASVTNNPVTIIADFSDEPVPTNHPAAGPGSVAAVQEAATLGRRLGAAGAKSGDVQFSLFWWNYNDLDLHCIDPLGVEIWYSHKRSELTGGRLDLDQNAGFNMSRTPIENIFWPSRGAPAGIYKLFVDFYARHDFADATPYTVRTVVRDKTNLFHHTIRATSGQRTHWICTIQYDPENPDPALRCRFLPFQQ